MSQPRKMENMMQVGGTCFQLEMNPICEICDKVPRSRSRASVNEMSCDKVVDKESYG